jgi:hypothetical protein
MLELDAGRQPRREYRLGGLDISNECGCFKVWASDGSQPISIFMLRSVVWPHGQLIDTSVLRSPKEKVVSTFLGLNSLIILNDNRKFLGER